MMVGALSLRTLNEHGRGIPMIATAMLKEGKKYSPSDLLSRGVVASLGGVDLPFFLEDLDGLGDLFALDPQSLGDLAGAHGLPGILHGLKNGFCLLAHQITCVKVQRVWSQG